MNKEKIYEPKDDKKAEQLVQKLMAWYHQSHRDLIWRKTCEPYRIWISEIMAQQTRITAVLPYYERFMAKFPTLKSLADAEVDEVLKAWEGLGYYSRAHNLLKTARILQIEHGGEFPQTAAALKKLPGIGDYTAGAIASICFDEAVPAVDGNVQRVFARVYGNRLSISDAANKKLLTEFLIDLMPKTETGIWNQSLMELGALICAPKSPACTSCPVQGICVANQTGVQQELPIKAAKKAVRQEDKTILLLINEKGEVLVHQRKERLLAGLWEFYMADGKLEENNVAVYAGFLGLQAEKPVFIGRATHIFTHMQWNMQGWQCRVSGPTPEDFRFIPIEEVEEIAMPTAIQFFRDWLLGTGQTGLSGI